MTDYPFNKTTKPKGRKRIPLNERHHRFVENYLGAGPKECIGNARKSAIEAGYRPKNASQTSNLLMQRPEIIEAIAAGQQRQRDFAVMSINKQEQIIADIIAAGHEKVKDASVKDTLVALAELAKRQGLYKPIKQEITGLPGTLPGGNSSQENLTPEQMLLELDRIKAVILETVVNVEKVKTQKLPENKPS